MTTLDLASVRGYTKDLEDKIRQCDNGEGMRCADLDDRIDHYVKLFEQVRENIDRWARAVFTGRIEFDQEVEGAFLAQIDLLLDRANPVAAHGRQMNGWCCELHGPNLLHHHMADLYYLRENWASPRLSVSPAPRVQLSQATEQEIAKRLETLSPLPADWQPSDPEQLAIFRKHRAK